MQHVKYETPIGISIRHLHLSARDRDLLFGENFSLTKLKDLSQGGEYAALETVTIVGRKGAIEKVRVLGPERSESQVELSISDLYAIGLTAPVRESGDLAGTPGVAVIGPKGLVKLANGLICAKRHIHMNQTEAKRFNVQNGQIVSIKTSGERAIILNNVVIRIKETFQLECHLDSDESNCAGVKNGEIAEILL